MSVIHDALKRARQPQRAPGPGIPAAARPAGAGGTAPSWLWWFTLALFLVESTAHFYTFQSKRKAEDKLQKALLQLNDERAKTLELLAEKAEFDSRLAEVQNQRDAAYAQKEAIAKAKQDLEFDNLEKEKKAYEMSKQIHELEMTKWQLTNEIDALKHPVVPTAPAAKVQENSAPQQ